MISRRPHGLFTLRPLLQKLQLKMLGPDVHYTLITSTKGQNCRTWWGGRLLDGVAVPVDAKKKQPCVTRIKIPIEAAYL